MKTPKQIREEIATLTVELDKASSVRNEDRVPKIPAKIISVRVTWPKPYQVAVYATVLNCEERKLAQKEQQDTYGSSECVDCPERDFGMVYTLGRDANNTTCYLVHTGGGTCVINGDSGDYAFDRITTLREGELVMLVSGMLPRRIASKWLTEQCKVVSGLGE